MAAPKGTLSVLFVRNNPMPDTKTRRWQQEWTTENDDTIKKNACRF